MVQYWLDEKTIAKMVKLLNGNVKNYLVATDIYALQIVALLELQINNGTFNLQKQPVIMLFPHLDIV